jgi:hypothetical protein
MEFPDYLMVMPVMAMFATFVLIMFLLFIVFGRFFPFHIHAAISLNIVRPPRINQYVYAWRSRQETIDAYIHIGRTWQPGRCRETGTGFIDIDAGYNDCQ